MHNKKCFTTINFLTCSSFSVPVVDIKTQDFNSLYIYIYKYIYIYTRGVATVCRCHPKWQLAHLKIDAELLFFLIRNKHGQRKGGLQMLQHPQEDPKHCHCTHNKWNKLKTFYLLLRIHNSALQYNVTWLAGALFELTAFYLKIDRFLVPRRPVPD